MSNPSFEDVVKEAHPRAMSEYRPPVKESHLPHEVQGYWAVLTSPELGCKRLGQGETALRAWENAARALEFKLAKQV